MNLEHLAHAAQVATACIAFSAAVVAIVSLRAQKKMAARRAAIDFFLKTDMDENILEIRKRYDDAIKKFWNATDKRAFFDSDQYDPILKYLNIQELLAVGVRRKVFDEAVSYAYWCDDLKRTCNDTVDLMPFALERDKYAFKQLVALRDRWNSCPRVWQWWRDEGLEWTTNLPAWLRFRRAGVRRY